MEEEKVPTSKQEPQPGKENPEVREKVSGIVEIPTDKIEEGKERNVDEVVKSAPTPKPITETDQPKNRLTPGKPKKAETDGEASSSEYEMDWVSNDDKKSLNADKPK